MPDGKHAVVTTQNGYVVILALSHHHRDAASTTTHVPPVIPAKLQLDGVDCKVTPSKRDPGIVLVGRMHTGSIEGLVLHPPSDLIVTVSGDTSIHAYTIRET